MDKTEFKAALSAMSVPVKDEAALTVLLAKVTGGAATVSLDQWIAYLTELKTDKVSRPGESAALRLQSHARLRLSCSSFALLDSSCVARSLCLCCQDTPQQITDAFRTLADGRESVSVEGLHVPPLTQEDVDFLSTAIPAHADGGLDYSAYVANSFAQ